MQIAPITTTGGTILDKLLTSLPSFIQLFVYGLIIYILLLVIKCLKLYLKNNS